MVVYVSTCHTCGEWLLKQISLLEESFNEKKYVVQLFIEKTAVGRSFRCNVQLYFYTMLTRSIHESIYQNHKLVFFITPHLLYPPPTRPHLLCVRRLPLLSVTSAAPQQQHFSPLTSFFFSSFPCSLFPHAVAHSRSASQHAAGYGA